MRQKLPIAQYLKSLFECGQIIKGCNTGKCPPFVKSTPSRQERSETDALRLSPPS